MNPSHHHRTFVETWLGRPWQPSDGVSVPPSLALPEALRDIYQAMGNVESLARAHNELLAPSELRREAGYTIFFVENQGVAVWGYRDADTGLEDPQIFQGQSTEDGWEWHPEHMVLKTWFQIMAYWQLLNGGYLSGGYAAEISGAGKTVSRVLPKLGGHPDGSTQFYGKPGQLVCVAGTEESSSVWAAASTEAGFTQLNKLLGFDWDYSSENE